MSNNIKVSSLYDFGPCAVPCTVCNANGVDIYIDNGECGQGHIVHNISLCDKHALNLANKILKAIGPKV